MQNTIRIILCLLLVGCGSTQESASQIHDLCYNHFYGKNGYLKDYRQALNWCEKSAELNSTSGQVLVAELYYFGYGVEQDFATAAHFYRLAAVQQHQHAQVMVFLINNVYNAEQSTNAEKVDGLLMLELAKEAGYAKAQQIYEEVYVK